MAQPHRWDSFVSFLWQCLLESVSKKAVRQEVAAFYSGNGTFSGPSPLPSHLQAAIVSHPPAFISSPVKWRRLIFDTAPVSPWLQLRLFIPQKTVKFSPFDVTRPKSFFFFYAASWLHLSTAATDEIPVWQTLIRTHMWKVLFEIHFFFFFFMFWIYFYCVKLVLMQTKLFLQLLLHITSVQLCAVELWIFFWGVGGFSAPTNWTIFSSCKSFSWQLHLIWKQQVRVTCVCQACYYFPGWNNLRSV